MRKTIALCVVIVLLAEAPAHAIIVDTFVSGVQYAQNAAYQAFMKLKVIEELQILKQNYDSSVRYYDEFKRLNQGRGFLYNVGQELKTAELREIEILKSNVDRDFVHTYKTDTAVDQFFLSIDHSIGRNMKYAGDEMANLIQNRKLGVDIAKNAEGLSPRDAANLTVKAQGIQIQYLSQLHEDNLRIMELQSLQLATQSRQQAAEQKLIDNIRQSVGRLAPEAVQEKPE